MGLFVHAGEIDDGAEMGGGDELSVDAGEEGDHVVVGPEFGVFAFDVAGAELADGFDFDSVEDGGEELLPAGVARSDGDPDELSGLVFVSFVAEPDGGGFSVTEEEFVVKLGVEVQRIHRVVRAYSISSVSETVMWSLVWVLLGVLGTYGLALWLVAKFSVSPVRIPKWISPGQMGFAQEAVELMSADGLKLRGWWSEAEGDLVVIFGHGYLMNRCEFVPFLMTLNPRPSGFFFDFRAHGTSQGKTCSFGPKEAADVQAALAWVRARKPGARVVYVGSSMGAAAGVLALSPSPDAVDGLVLDGCYARLDEAAGAWWQFMGAGAFLSFLLTPASRIGQMLTGTNPKSVDIEAELRAFAGKPVMLLNGDRDPLVPKASAERLARAVGETAEMVFFPGSTHGAARLEHPQAYVGALQRFLDGVQERASGEDPRPDATFESGVSSNRV